MTKEAGATLKNIRILIVGSDDSEGVPTIAGMTAIGLDADVTILNDELEARDLAALGVYDAMIVVTPEWQCCGLLAGEDCPNVSATPVVLISGSMKPADMMQAVRSGAFDVLTHPVDGQHLARTLCRAARTSRLRKAATSRQQRLRTLSSRLVRDRRDLRRRVDLICQDLVQAYRRLAERVVTSQSEATGF